MYQSAKLLQLVQELKATEEKFLFINSLETRQSLVEARIELFTKLLKIAREISKESDICQTYWREKLGQEQDLLLNLI